MERREGFVYGLYDVSTGLCKIGHTKRPDVRLRDHGLGKRDEIRLVFCIDFGLLLCHRVERLVHEHLANARTAPLAAKDGGTEWFQVDLKHMQWLADLLERFARLLEGYDPSQQARLVNHLKAKARETRGSVLHG